MNFCSRLLTAILGLVIAAVLFPQAVSAADEKSDPKIDLADGKILLTAPKAGFASSRECGLSITSLPCPRRKGIRKTAA